MNMETVHVKEAQQASAEQRLHQARPRPGVQAHRAGGRPAGRGDGVVGHGRPVDGGWCFPPPASTWPLRAGNAIEAAIPIAILAIFFGRKGLKRSGKSTILENVIVQSIGQASGVVAAGAAFIIPALYINRLDVHWWQIFLACAIGGFLGIVLIIPLRKYFVKDLHGELPFPEATAINEILVSGESTSKSAGKVLLAAFGLGAAYDFLVEAVHAWNPDDDYQDALRDARREDVVHPPRHIDQRTGGALWPGLHHRAALCGRDRRRVGVRLPGAGAVDFPLWLAAFPSSPMPGHTYVIANMDSDAIFVAFVKPIGIGAIAVSAIIGIIRMGKIVARLHRAWLQGTQGRRRGGGAAHSDRHVSAQRRSRSSSARRF